MKELEQDLVDAELLEERDRNREPRGKNGA